jgi:threonine dehydratase
MSVTLADIEAAAGRLKGHAAETPLIESPALNDLLGRRILIKPETLQRVGAFKFRGAFNRLVQLTHDERARGVVAFSSGNHAQGVALAARLLSIPAVIVMPHDAPRIKVEATKGYGAEVRHFDRFKESREAIAAEIAAERGCVVVPSFDDVHIIAGQGTVGLELAHEAMALEAKLDVVVTPIGGGGLISGVATAIKGLSPDTDVWGVEPARFDDTQQSLKKGERVTIHPTERSLCDALETVCPGEITFPIIQKTLSGIALVDDREVAAAMRYAFQMLKLVVEPGGAVGLAALLNGKIPGSGPVGLVLSGGNVDPDLFGQAIRGEL